MRVLLALVAGGLLATSLAACADDYYDTRGYYYRHHDRDRNYYRDRDYSRNRGDYDYDDSPYR